MKFQYYPDTDSLCIDLSDEVSVDSREVAPRVALDFDAKGRLVGIDIDHAAKSLAYHAWRLRHCPLAAFH